MPSFPTSTYSNMPGGSVFKKPNSSSGAGGQYGSRVTGSNNSGMSGAKSYGRPPVPTTFTNQGVLGPGGPGGFSGAQPYQNPISPIPQMQGYPGAFSQGPPGMSPPPGSTLGFPFGGPGSQGPPGGQPIPGQWGQPQQSPLAAGLGGFMGGLGQGFRNLAQQPPPPQSPFMAGLGGFMGGMGQGLNNLFGFGGAEQQVTSLPWFGGGGQPPQPQPGQQPQFSLAPGSNLQDFSFGQPGSNNPSVSLQQPPQQFPQAPTFIPDEGAPPGWPRPYGNDVIPQVPPGGSTTPAPYPGVQPLPGPMQPSDAGQPGFNQPDQYPPVGPEGADTTYGSWGGQGPRQRPIRPAVGQDGSTGIPGATVRPGGGVYIDGGGRVGPGGNPQSRFRPGPPQIPSPGSNEFIQWTNSGEAKNLLNRAMAGGFQPGKAPHHINIMRAYEFLYGDLPSDNQPEQY